MGWIPLRFTTCSFTTSDYEKVLLLGMDYEVDIGSFEEGEGMNLDIADLHDLTQFDLLIRPLTGYYVNKTFDCISPQMQISLPCDCSRVLPFPTLQSDAGRSCRKSVNVTRPDLSPEHR